MLRVATRRLCSLPPVSQSWRPIQAASSAIFSRNPIDGGYSCSSSSFSDDRKSGPLNNNHVIFPQFHHLRRGFASEITSKKEDNTIPEVPPTVAAVKNPSPKLVLSTSASKDVLALASLEVDLSNIEPGSTVTVKWRGKPVFIRHRTDEDIKLANSVDLVSLRDPQSDVERVKNPEWLVVVGVCTHFGCIPLPNAGDFGGWFCPCHGSHYDISGRIRKGPAPYNLEVPTYTFLDDNKLLIG